MVRLSTAESQIEKELFNKSKYGNYYFSKPKNVQTRCNKSLANFTANMLVDETHKLLYCFVPKVGCTTWKKIFAILTNEKLRNETKGNPENIKLDPHSIRFKSMKDYNSSQREIILKSYFKFMFVREPFERLVSAYIDKFYVPELNGFWESWGRRIIKRYREKASAVSKACGHDVTFEEFLSHSLSKVQQADISGGNEHWTTMHQICNPCGIKYDYIGHVETMRRDTDVILHQANVSHLIVQDEASVSNIRQNLHISDEALIKSEKCLEPRDAVKRIINSLIYKGFLPNNFSIAEFTRNSMGNNSNMTNEEVAKLFNAKLDDILPRIWENKLKSSKSIKELNREHSLIRLQKSNISGQISSQIIKRFLKYFSLDFEAFGYDTKFYSNYMTK
ncbi:unnamed protein product, partial [Owenia fusiformis]